MANSTPRIVAGALRYRDGSRDQMLPVGQTDWWGWLASDANSTFRFESEGASYTARREGGYWYAYRKRARQLVKIYLGKSSDLGLDRLEAVAASVAQRVAPSQKASDQARPPGAEFPPRARQQQRFERHNLPVGLTSFVGRERELADVVRLLDTARLVTLTGPGGVGKTRLALGAAERVLSDFRSGVWLVDLSPLADPALVPQMVAAVLGVREGRDRSLLPAIIDRIGATQQMLLVLDNCEHIAAATANLVEALLGACQRLTVLATSREALRVPGEVARQVPALSLPEPPLPPLDQLRRYAAVQLFIERAESISADFTLNSHNAQAVVDICWRLDGLPLAIELAAAWTQLLTPQQLLTRLRDRFHLLVGGGRSVSPRQQTMRGVIDWSHALLAQEERVLFRRIAVFAGGFTLDAAEAVCAGEDISAASVLQLLGQLVRKSLVTTETRQAAGAMRYRMLETIRAYAWERAREAGEIPTLERRHRESCLAIAEQKPPQMLAPDQIACLAQELDNMRAALRSAIEIDDADSGLRLGLSMWPLWYVRGLYAEGRAWLAELLALPSARPGSGDRSRALAFAGHLAFCEGDLVAAEEFLGQALEEARALRDEQATAVALQLLGTPARGRGDLTRAESLYEEARSINKRLGSSAWEAISVANLAMAAEDRGDHARAELLATEALALYTQQRHAWGVARMREVLGRVAVSRADYRTAHAQLEEAVAFQRELGDRQGMVLSLPTLAQLALGEGRAVEAGRLLAEGLALAREAGDKLSVARGLEAVAILLKDVHPEAAIRLMGTAGALRDRLGAELAPAHRARLETLQASALRLLGAEAYASALADGRRRPLDQAIADAITGTEAVTSVRTPASDALTAREREVAVLLARGLTNRQIGEALVITTGTARIHAERVLAKLGLQSRVQVAAWARTHGLLHQEDGQDMAVDYAYGR